MARNWQQEREYRETGRAAFDRGEYAEAGRWFEKAASAHPTRPWGWLWLARARLRLDDREGSYEAIERARQADRNVPHVVWHLVSLLRHDGDVGRCVSLLSELMEARAGDLPVRRRATQLLTDMEAYDEALPAAGRLLELAPWDDTGVFLRALCLHRLGRTREAEELLAAARRQGDAGHRATARYHLALEDGMAAWTAVRDVDLDAELLCRIGLCLRRCGFLAAAAEAFARSRAAGSEPAARWAAVVDGEMRVLSGRWSHRPDPVGRVLPLPGRVLHLVGKSRPHVQSGYTVRTHYVARAQRAAGLDPQVVTQLGFPLDQGVMEAAVAEDFDGVAYHRLPAPDGELPSGVDDRLDANVDQLAALVRSLRPAVLHAASDYRNGLLALQIRDAFGIPVVYEVRGFWEETWMSKQDAAAPDSDAYRWRRDRELECMLAADRVVTLSDGMREEIVSRGVDPCRVAVVPNAVDVEAFVPVDRDAELAGRLGFGPGDVVLGYVSSFSAYEGINYLVEATALLVERGLPVRCLLVGEGDEAAALRELAERRGIADRVLFTGRVPHDRVLDYYGLIDVFVVPRTNDRVCHLVTPLKPYEAMATARALVVSGVAALRGMVEEGVTAEVFEPENSGHLADVAERLVADESYRHAMGARSRAWVCDHRTWTANGEIYRRLYEEMHVTGEPTSPLRAPAPSEGRS